MLKKSLIYFVLSLLVVFFAPYAKILLLYINLLYARLLQLLQPMFGSTVIGEAFRDMIALILTPLLLATIPALFYWLIKRKKIPYLIELIWLFWLVLALSSYLIH